MKYYGHSQEERNNHKTIKKQTMNYSSVSVCEIYYGIIVSYVELQTCSWLYSASCLLIN